MKKNTKHAFVLEMNDYIGGAERRLLRVYNNIAKEKKVEVFVRGIEKKDFRKRIAQGDLELKNIENIYVYPRGKIQAIRCLLNIYMKSYTTIHYFDYSGFNSFLAKLGRLFKTKTILTIANHYYFTIDNFGGTMKGRNSLIKNSKCIDLLYPNMKKKVQEYANSKKVHITPGTYTNLDMFYPDKKENIILFAAARLTEDKGPVLLVKAIMLCAETLRKNKYKIIVLGQGGRERELKQYVINNKIDDIVEFKGYKNTHDYMPQSKVFMSLQIDNNYPSQSLAEAFACGCYIIVTDVGMTRLMVENSHADLVAGNPEDIAAAINRYIEMDDNIKKNIISDNRCFAEKKFDIKASIIYFKKLLDEENDKKERENEICNNRVWKNSDKSYKSSTK